MIVFPNCKINLGLRILSKRNDGFHNLETVFYPLPIKDALEVIVDQQNDLLPIPDIQFSSSGNFLEVKPEENICVKAYLLLKKDFPQLPEIKMHLHKAIPIGAGLGGGSADGAFALKLLNQKFNLGLSDERLIYYALQLGSDCPFFVVNEPCFATGRGEVLEKINIDLSGYNFFLVNPGIHISTNWAFSETTPARPQKSIKEIIQQPVESWKDELKNDFEEAVFKKYPEIKSIKDNLYGSNAIYAGLSGSGSSVFGIFKKATQINLQFPAHYFIKELPGELK